jgi:hypothetical protein
VILDIVRPFCAPEARHRSINGGGLLATSVPTRRAPSIRVGRVATDAPFNDPFTNLLNARHAGCRPLAGGPKNARSPKPRSSAQFCAKRSDHLPHVQPTRLCVAASPVGAADGSRAVNRGYSGGKRNREASRDLRKKQKEQRLRRNRELRARGGDPDLTDMAEATAPLPEVKLEDVVIGVPPRPRRDGFGPVKLFVGGLSPATATADLRAAFAKFGELIDVAVINERGTNQSRGFGFVTFATSTAADAATKEMDGAELDGRNIKVNRADDLRR